MWRSIF